MIVLCMSIASLNVTASAAGNIEIIDSLPEFGQDYIPASLLNYSIDDKMNSIGTSPQEDVIEIIVSNDDVEIEANMYSEFIDVFGKLSNGKYINITDEVICEFQDKSIATWIFGRILADKRGSTIAILKYNGLSKTIRVTVNNQIIPDSDIPSGSAFIGENSDINSVIDPFQSERDAILNIAVRMVRMEWTPTETFNGYDRPDEFKAGTKYTGMPYTQIRYQSTYDEFFTAFYNSSSNDFYEYYAEHGTEMPRYGNDCAGFLSICWGLYRNDTWRNRWNTTDFNNAITDGTFSEVDFEDLKPGDALYRRGHVMLVKSVAKAAGRITVYEQTGATARETIFTFAQLNADSYKGFSKFC